MHTACSLQDYGLRYEQTPDDQLVVLQRAGVAASVLDSSISQHPHSGLSVVDPTRAPEHAGSCAAAMVNILHMRELGMHSRYTKPSQLFYNNSTRKNIICGLPAVSDFLLYPRYVGKRKSHRGAIFRRICS
jgi:hypothetical protein